MLRYSGLTRGIDEWKPTDVDRIKYDLTLSIISAENVLRDRLAEVNTPEQLIVLNGNEPTVQDARTYMRCINVLFKWMNSLSEAGITEFDNPPMVFDVVGKEVKIIECPVVDLLYFFKDELRNEDIIIKDDIKKKELPTKLKKRSMFADMINHRIEIMSPSSRGLHFRRLTSEVRTWAECNNYRIERNVVWVR